MAFDAFLKLEGIEGESQDSKHKGEIEIESFSFGEANYQRAASGGGAGAGKVSMQDFHFTIKTSKASPKLFLSCATGKHHVDGLLTLRKAGGDQLEYMKIKLSDILISSYELGGVPAGDDVPMDQVSINFSKIEYSYSTQKADGSLDSPVVVVFDRKTNTGG